MTKVLPEARGNVLPPDFAEMGAAYAVEPKATLEIYWTQVFGAR